jgi:DNA polymerase III epsilon subunit-like protein
MLSTTFRNLRCLRRSLISRAHYIGPEGTGVVSDSAAAAPLRSYATQNGEDPQRNAAVCKIVSVGIFMLLIRNDEGLAVPLTTKASARSSSYTDRLETKTTDVKECSTYYNCQCAHVGQQAVVQKQAEGIP